MSGNDIAVLMSLMGAAVALAGFAGIVTSIDRSALGVSSGVITFRVLNLIVAALTSVVLAMLPILIEALEIARHSLWQFASMAGAGAIAALTIAAFFARMRMRHGHDQGLSRPLFVANLTLGSMAVLVEVAGAIGALPGRGAYFVGLFYLQYLMGTLFYRMVHMADEAARSAVRR